MKYDLIIIGAGPGGYTAAIKAASAGLKTALIEKTHMGGTCLNLGCIPTKALLHEAERYAHGLLPESGRAGMFARKDEIVSNLRSGVEKLVSSKKVDVFYTEARIASAGEVCIVCPEPAVLKADKILIAAGSYASLPPIPGINLNGVVTSDGLLDGMTFKRLAIIGGGVIGVEYASIYSALGLEVSIIEAMDRILPLMDRDISLGLNMILKKRGINIHTSGEVTSIEQASGGLKICFKEKGVEKEKDCDKILVATGRKPNIGEVFAQGPIPETERGAFKVNSRFETSIPGIYAIGDCTGGRMLAHEASAQAVNFVDSLTGRAPTYDLTVIPACIYTEPEAASAGLSEEEAKKAGLRVKVGKFPMHSNARAFIEHMDRGIVKLIFEQETEVLLGAHIISSRATDIIGQFVLAVANKMTYTEIRRAIMPHPSFSEGIVEALDSVR